MQFKINGLCHSTFIVRASMWSGDEITVTGIDSFVAIITPPPRVERSLRLML